MDYVALTNSKHFTGTIYHPHSAASVVTLRSAKVIKTFYEPRHEISNNVVCATNKDSDQPAHTLEYSLSVKQLTTHHLEILSLKGDCTGSSESTVVEMPHCWKLHVSPHISFFILRGPLTYTLTNPSPS